MVVYALWERVARVRFPASRQLFKIAASSTDGDFKNLPVSFSDIGKKLHKISARVSRGTQIGSI